MKKISALIIMLVMLVSIASLAIADDAGENNENEQNEENGHHGVDTETEKEIEIMNNSLGAEIRLLQLQKSLLKNILKGEMAVEVLKGLEFNTTVLESILDEMEVLLEDVKVANTTSNESVQIFVELKSQAKNLTTQFRETIKELLDDVSLNELRDRIKEIVSEQIQDLSKNILHRIRQFNRNQIYRLYGLIGETNNSFVEQYINGTINLSQVKLQICKIINNMTKEYRYDVFSEIKEENIKKKIHSEASIDEMNNNGKGKGKGRQG